MIYVLIPTTPDRGKRLARTIASVRKSVCDQEIKVVIKLNNYEGAVKALWQLVTENDGLAFFLGNDVLVKPNTIQELYNAYIRHYPEQDGMCVPIDETIGREDTELTFTHPFAHTKTFQNVIYRGYFHNFVDREWTAIMKKKNKWILVDTAFINHQHYSRNPDLIDETYKVGSKYSDQDGELFYERQCQGFPR